MMKCVAAMLGILLLSGFLFYSNLDGHPGTDPRIEKLKSQLPTLTGEKKADRLNLLSSEHVMESPKIALEYADQALALSRELKYPKGEAFALRARGDALDNMRKRDEARQHYDSALAIFTRLKMEKDAATIYNKLGFFHRRKNNLALALKNHRLALAIYEKRDDTIRLGLTHFYIGNNFLRGGQLEEAEKAYKQSLVYEETEGDKVRMARTLVNLGLVYYSKHDYPKALETFHRTRELYESAGNKSGIAKTLANIGLVYDVSGEFSKAVEFYMKALKIHEEMGDKREMAIVLNNLGIINKALKNYRQALDYYKKAVVLEEEYGHPANVATMYNNIGIIYKDLKKFDMAFENYEKSLAISKKIRFKRGLALVYLNYGIIYGELDKREKSLDFYKKALEINRELKNRWGEASNLHAIGVTYIELKKYSAAGKNLKKAMEIAEDIKIKELVRDCHQNLSVLYADQGKYKLAYQYHTKWAGLRHEIIDKDTSARIEELKTKYETEKKEKEIVLLKKNNELLQKNNEIQRLTLSKQKFRTNAFIVGFILVVIIALLLLKKYVRLFVFWKKRNYIGHYKIIDKIGQGGMGIIYKATHVRSKSEPVAVKVIREEFSKDETQRKRFLNEALLVDQLNHPNIIKVYERGEYNDQLFIAMEMLDGPSLAEIIENGDQLAMDDCILIMSQLADTVARLHSKGIVHRDLKPDNIVLVQKAGQPRIVKLLDFGLAFTQSITRLTGTGEIVGTINYLPPEQISRRQYSSASDIYSLGVVFYELLTFQQPYIGELPVDIIKQILDKEPVPPSRFRPDLPERLDHLVMQMMNKEPDQRPTEDLILNTLHQTAPEKEAAG